MNTADQIELVIAGYNVIEALYTGSRTLVYRAIRVCDQQPVILKTLRNEYPSFNELVQFRNQYTIAKNLNLPGIIQTYNLEPYGNGYALVMEDFGGMSLGQFVQKYPLDITTFLAIAIQIADILHGLYQNRVIHKDIKPANILIHPDSKKVKLIDFSISSLLPRETQEIQNPNILEGTLAYISPEQTGRMNRGIDYRSDFYSLGVTFYELLTGQLPFPSDDPMELVHCHLAASASPIPQINSNIPIVISQIVAKLMAKNAEDRYQSALGLKQDLQQCLTEWKETEKISEFVIAQNDRSDRFTIPEKLYGREREVAQLLAAFERISQPYGETGRWGDGEKTCNSEMMLVAGFSGIGKTAVINEVHKPIVRQRGYFIKGKFDQFNRNIPFSAFVQALRDLMSQLLSESDTQLANWKTKILEAVGENGQVIVDVIPELEHIVGQQPPVTELSGSAAQNRFNLLFQKFIQVFTQKEHPLVIFMDDLQWADLASLNLLKLLTTESEKGYLLILGAYRDNEVFPAHPLMLTLDKIQKSKATVNTITLATLAKKNVNKLVADTLNFAEELARPLTELVFQKTKGNPFFTTQFLKALHQEGWIEFNQSLGYWQCDMASVRQLALTDDVVEFMAAQLHKLPSETQELLKLAACIGNQFDLNTVAMISEQSEADAADGLWKALQEGLILPISETYKFFQSKELEKTHRDRHFTVPYKFLHDRVQQAAYSLIPEIQKQATHYQIGKRLLLKLSLEERDERIFDIVNQINIGQTLIEDDIERKQLIELNLSAAQKAKAATAYEAAKTYFQVGIDLLAQKAWTTSYDLAFQLHLALAEAQLMSADFESLEKTIATLIECANSPLDRAKIYVLKVNQYSLQGPYTEAIKAGLEGLQGLGITVKRDTLKELIQEDFTAIEKKLENRSIISLLDLPTATNPEVKAAIELLMNLLSAAYIISDIDLYSFTTLRDVHLSIEHGNIPKSIMAYVNYGFWLVLTKNQYQRGLEFADLALQLSYKLNSKSQQSSACFLLGGWIHVWAKPIQGAAEINYEGFLAGMDSGELQYAGYNLFANIYNRLFQGENLATIVIDLDKYWSIAEKIQNDLALSILAACRFFINRLSRTLDQQDPSCLLAEEQAWIEHHQASQSYLPLGIYYILQMHEACLSQSFDRGIHYGTEALRFLTACAGSSTYSGYYYYGSLNLLGLYLSLPEVERRDALHQIEANQAQLKIWSESCPENFLHKYLLVEAERSQIEGKRLEAIELYDRAIAGAKANEYIQEEALSNELAAKFYLDWGKEKVAAGYMQAAYYCYAKWGAKAKTDDLEKRYPNLLKPILQTAAQSLNLIETLASIAAPNLSIHASTKTNHSSSGSINAALDFAAVLKASQAISGTLQLDELLCQLSQIILQNSGGDRCALILPNPTGEWQVEAVATPKNTELCSEPLEDNPNLPVKLIQYVKNTREMVMIDNLNTDLPVIDEYLSQQQPQSVLCLPILNQGQLIGILYLRNQSTSDVFTQDRILVLNFLCTQAAISLENAQLYQESIATQQQLLQQKQKLERSQVQLSTNKSALRAILDNAPIWIWMTDIHGKMLFVNQTFCDDVGASEQDFTSASHYKEVIGEEAARNCIKSDQACLAQDSPFYFIEILTLVDRKQHTLETIKTQVKDKHNSTIGIIGLGIDVTESEQMKSEIKEKNDNLEKALQELKSAQIQLVQGEKMSALGNLVAGVAHEINNPLGFITGNLNETQQSMQDVIEHLNLYRMSTPPTPEIEEHQEEIDLEYLLDDLPKMIDSMGLGCDRIKNISTSLRTFSRADQEYKTAFNLHDGLESTLLILKHRLKANDNRPEITINKNYGELPEVECFPGQLNQVFMNLLANAIDMFDEVAQQSSLVELKAKPQIITIKTTIRTEKNAVEIRISDNGKGMTEEVKMRIFDHLFTTKDVGKGTGLGLAIARQIIVEKHGGSLDVYSTLNKGSEFVITLGIETGG